MGDDSQAINRFAGADLSVMTDFSSWFGEAPPTLRLQTTFRSPQSICDTANQFVASNPRQLTKAVKSIRPCYGPPASLVRVAGAPEVATGLSSVLAALASRVRSGEIAPGPSGSVE